MITFPSGLKVKITYRIQKYSDRTESWLNYGDPLIDEVEAFETLRKYKASNPDWRDEKTQVVQVVETKSVNVIKETDDGTE